MNTPADLTPTEAPGTQAMDSQAMNSQAMNTRSNQVSSPQWDVAAIGGGPTGLSAAIELSRQGVQRVVVLERQQEAGGVPRYCSHSPFGFREFRRCLTGPQYARRLIRQAIDYGVDIQTQTSVIRLSPQGCLQLSKPSGSSTINAKKVLIATGVRETPRAPRLISGQRPQGITTTGALQSTVLLTREKFFEHPVIIGTELVAFSALLTCLKAGIRPMAMIEQNSRVTA